MQEPGQLKLGHGEEGGDSARERVDQGGGDDGVELATTMRLKYHYVRSITYARVETLGFLIIMAKLLYVCRLLHTG